MAAAKKVDALEGRLDDAVEKLHAEVGQLQSTVEEKFASAEQRSESKFAALEELLAQVLAGQQRLGKADSSPVPRIDGDAPAAEPEKGDHSGSRDPGKPPSSSAAAHEAIPAPPNSSSSMPIRSSTDDHGWRAMMVG